MPQGLLSSCRPRPWGPPYSGDPVLQGPHYPGCPRPRGSPAPSTPRSRLPQDSGTPYSGDLLPRRPTIRAVPVPGDFSCPGRRRPGACEPRAPQLQAPRRAPRAALPLPVSHCGAWSLSAPALLHPSFPPWGLGSALHPLCPLPVGSLPQVCLCLPSLCPCSQHPSLWCSTALFTPLRVINSTLVRFVEWGARVRDFFAFSSGGVTALGLGLRVLFWDSSALVCVPSPGAALG